MNTIKYKGIIGIISAIAFLLIVISAIYPKPEIAQGSIKEGQEYNATTTRDFDGTALTNFTVLKSRAGSLGQVTITGAAAGRMIFYDATTTDATARTNTATTTIADFPLSTAAGTYTFDASFSRGLLYEIVGTQGTSTITWR